GRAAARPRGGAAAGRSRQGRSPGPAAAQVRSGTGRRTLSAAGKARLRPAEEDGFVAVRGPAAPGPVRRPGCETGPISANLGPPQGRRRAPPVRGGFGVGTVGGNDMDLTTLIRNRPLLLLALGSTAVVLQLGPGCGRGLTDANGRVGVAATVTPEGGAVHPGQASL